MSLGIWRIFRKVRSLKMLVFGFTMAVIASATEGFANHNDRELFENVERHNDNYCPSHVIVEKLKDQLRKDLEIQINCVNNIYTFLGASANPNPNTNLAIAGLITANLQQIQVVGADALNIFRKLGVHHKAIDLIMTKRLHFIVLLFNMR